MPGRVRVAALLLAGLVLAASCGTRGDDAVVDPSSTTVTTMEVPVTGELGAPVPRPGEPPVMPQPSGEPVAPGAPAGDPDGGGADPPAPDAGSPVTPAGAVGSLGPRYLRPAESERILIQVLVQDGATPQPAVPERLRQVLSSLSRKPVSVATVAVDGGPRSWTGDELRALADTSSPAQTREQAVLTVQFLRGGFAENEQAVGVAVRGDVAAIFGERVTEAAGVFGSRTAIEDAVSMHEVGHLLGLVDLVVDGGRADPEHPGHSPNRGSVMYYAVESTLLGSILSGGPPRDFDQDDLDELTLIRNG